nr:glutaredoxin [Croceicoccus mobilis]
MFGFEWCEFCWSARAMLDDCGVPYRTVNLDAADADKAAMAELRQALFARCKVPFVPQIFVGERLIGGCSELFAAYADGSLQAALATRGHVLGHNDNFDPAAYLPKWMQARA